jgi:hypothetical protein
VKSQKDNQFRRKIMPDMPAITPDSLIATLDNLKAEYVAIIDQLDIHSPMPSIGEWSARQVLSHIIGSLNRVPIHTGYYLAGASPVPVVFSDPYWIDAWHDAPIQAFKAAFEAAIEGNKGLVCSLPSDAFGRIISVAGFGELSLAVFLMVNYNNHVKEQHLHQLGAFVEVAQPA